MGDVLSLILMLEPYRLIANLEADTLGDKIESAVVFASMILVRLESLMRLLLRATLNSFWWMSPTKYLRS